MHLLIKLDQEILRVDHLQRHPRRYSLETGVGRDSRSPEAVVIRLDLAVGGAAIVVGGVAVVTGVVAREIRDIERRESPPVAAEVHALLVDEIEGRVQPAALQAEAISQYPILAARETRRARRAIAGLARGVAFAAHPLEGVVPLQGAHQHAKRLKLERFRLAFDAIELRCARFTR